MPEVDYNSLTDLEGTPPEHAYQRGYWGRYYGLPRRDERTYGLSFKERADREEELDGWDECDLELRQEAAERRLGHAYDLQDRIAVLVREVEGLAAES